MLTMFKRDLVRITIIIKPQYTSYSYDILFGKQPTIIVTSSTDENLPMKFNLLGDHCKYNRFFGLLARTCGIF